MSDSSITIDIRVVDALDVSCDVLVLKYAQELHGVDRRVADAIGVELTPEVLPPQGFRFVASTDSRITADAVLFLGVVRLRQFRYKEIREFTTRSLASLAAAASSAGHVALTLHGPGYGLDESECFLAELGGLVDAVVTGDVPIALRRISFVELNRGRASRMEDLLTRELPERRIERDPRALQRRIIQENSPLRSAGYASSEKRLAFVAMPINDRTEDLFHYGIRRPVDSLGLICERIDKVPATGDLVARIMERIQASSIVIGELTGSNPNVFLEIGYAWGLGKNTVLLIRADSVADLPFDVKTQSCVVYESIQDLEAQLSEQLQAILG